MIKNVRAGIILFIAVFSLLPFDYSFADEYGIESDIEATGKLADIEGNEAKFNEYRDIRDGLYGKVRLLYDSNYYFDFNASDIGYDTQRYRLDSGKWGSFKFYLDYNEIPHNFTFDAKSFYSGIGTNNLTYPVHPPDTDIRTWSNFDYSIERKSYGSGISLDMIKPFYLDVTVSREEKDGIYPAGVAGTTPGGIAIELPVPIDYTTDTLKIEAGYTKNPFFFSLTFFLSEFENDNHNLSFRNPATANTASTTDVLTLPPDNNYNKLSFKGGVKLPLNSKFNLNLATSRTASEVNLLNFFVDDVSGGRVPIALSDRTFDGKIGTQNYNFVLTSNPVRFIDGKFYYKYYNRENKSDEITTISEEETLINSLFDYKKDDYGIELGFRLPASIYLITGYNHVLKEREREDVTENKDDIYSIDLKWSKLDFITLKAGYEKLHRSAEFHAPDVSPDDPEFINTFLRRFDVAAKDRDTYKASIEVYPVESLNFSIGYKNKNTDYKDVILGLREVKGNEFNIDIDYTFGKHAKFMAYYDYEKARCSQFQRQLPFNAVSGFDPSTPPAPTAFNWDVKQKDKSYDYGFGADIYIIPKKLTLKLLHDYIRSNGDTDLTYHLGDDLLPLGRTQDNIDISNWDDYTLRTYAVKVVYNAAKKLSLSAAYVYEKFTYSDAQLDGYQFVPAATGTNGAFLTGAYEDQSYRANVIYVSIAYRF
jgi:MtrB/PioB family decaheme-associated outer membrane protein